MMQQQINDLIAAINQVANDASKLLGQTFSLGITATVQPAMTALEKAMVESEQQHGEAIKKLHAQLAEKSAEIERLKAAANHTETVSEYHA